MISVLTTEKSYSSDEVDGTSERLSDELIRSNGSRRIGLQFLAPIQPAQRA
jgi:hypothetical protein